MNMEKIGQLIACQRKKMKYTQEEFGKLLGVSCSAVSKWERGLSCPDVSLINRIAVELKISLEQLLEGELVDPAISSNTLRQTVSGDEPSYKNKVVFDLNADGSLGIVSPYLFGNNLEHTRSSVCGGLSAQMLKNRKFVGNPSPMEGIARGWYGIGEKTYYNFASPYTHHIPKTYHMKRRLECNAQEVTNFTKGNVSGLGQHELSLKKGETYEFAIVAKSEKTVDVTVSLTCRWGSDIYAQRVLRVEGGTDWTRYICELTTETDDCDGDLRITFTERASLHIGSLSLMNRNNFRGMRPDVINAMKDIGIQVLRWPGGNFAGEYNWFEGLLPVDERAPLESYMNLETQPHTWGYDFHEINTDDFIALCREIGAEPFFTINLAWNTPEENAAWVEYCNGDETTEYGRIRAERGHKEPYHVMFWSLGNEFGYSHMEGDNSAAGYSHLARENGLKMLEKSPNISLFSSGCHPSAEWVKYSTKPLSDISKFVSLHRYEGGGQAKFYDEEHIEATYQKCITSVSFSRNILREMRRLLSESDIKISFDEWNLWHGWYRPSTVADGIFTALMLHMIIEEAPKCGIAVACQFEAVNESLINVNPHDAILSAAGQVFSVMKNHIGGAVLHVGEQVLATKKNGVTTITLINPLADESAEFSFSCTKDLLRSDLYEGKSVLPHSRFEVAHIEPMRSGDTCTLRVPVHSIAFVQF